MEPGGSYRRLALAKHPARGLLKTSMPSEQQQEQERLSTDEELREDPQAKVEQETATMQTTPTRQAAPADPMASDISPVPRAGASPATAWWLDQHGAGVAVSPGAAAQLQVRERGVWAERLATPTPSSTAPSSPDKSPGARHRGMSHDGFGTRPLSRQFNTPSAADPFPQEAYTAPLQQPVVPPSPHGDHQDRHHVQSTAMDVALSCWRRGEVGGQPRASSPTSVLSQSQVSSSGTANGRAAQVLPVPDECYDAESPHHPLGHWNQIKREGEISARLTASALRRDASNSTLFVEKGAVGTSCGQSSFGKLAKSCTSLDSRFQDLHAAVVRLFLRG